MATRAQVPPAVRVALVIAAVLVALSTASCAGLGARHQEPFMLHGMIYDDNGQPAAGVALQLDELKQATSDFNGRFFFTDVTPGEYTLSVSGKNLEPLTRSIVVNHPSEVLYLSVISVDGLYRSCIKALESKNWASADTYIDRAIAISPTSPLLRYAKAVTLAAPSRPERNWSQAETLLRGILSDGYAEAAVYLLLADICQYDKNDVAEAAALLGKYLRLEYDPDVESRLARLVPGGSSP